MKRLRIILPACLLALLLAGCAHSGQRQPPSDPAAAETEAAETGTAAPPTEVAGTDTEPETEAPETAEVPQSEETEETNVKLQMFIDDTPVAVAWEDNDAVSALQALCKDGPLTIPMSAYCGFEQVGPIGARLPSDDRQTTTAAGDIMLYSSSQLVVFYGSNSWAYTRLGHITDKDAAEMTGLLGNGDVTVTLRMENTE